jgi:hypothetical protein
MREEWLYKTDDSIEQEIHTVEILKDQRRYVSTQVYNKPQMMHFSGDALNENKEDK